MELGTSHFQMFAARDIVWQTCLVFTRIRYGGTQCSFKNVSEIRSFQPRPSAVKGNNAFTKSHSCRWFHWTKDFDPFFKNDWGENTLDSDSQYVKSYALSKCRFRVSHRTVFGQLNDWGHCRLRQRSNYDIMHTPWRTDELISRQDGERCCWFGVGMIELC